MGELVLRLGFVAGLAALAWLVLAAERATLPAAVTLSAGLVVFIGFAFVSLFVLAPSPLAPPDRRRQRADDRLGGTMGCRRGGDARGVVDRAQPRPRPIGESLSTRSLWRLRP